MTGKNKLATKKKVKVDAWPRTSRTHSEVLKVMEEYRDKVWYNQYKILAERIARGEQRLVPLEKWEASLRNTQIVPVNQTAREHWEEAKSIARRVEGKYDIKDTWPWTDFEWGMIKGKLAAFGWLLGFEWDDLDM